jgi:isoleucyl-tRNA synthetase
MLGFFPFPKKVISQIWAPILSFYAEQINDALRAKASLTTVDSMLCAPSIHLQQFVPTRETLSAREKAEYISMEKLRKIVAVLVEEKRSGGAFQKSEYASLEIKVGMKQQAAENEKEKKKGNEQKAKQKEDDCENIQAFLMRLPVEAGVRDEFLRSYFCVNNCKVTFDVEPDDLQLQEKVIWPAAARTKKGKVTTKGGGNALKERVKVIVEKAQGTLCFRCDSFYCPFEGERGGKNGASLGLCTNCQLAVSN